MMDSTTSPNKVNIQKKQPSPAICRWGAAFFWLMVWQLGSMALDQPLLLPAPMAVAVRLGELGITAQFWTVTIGSLLRILAGFLLGLGLGTALAVLTAAVPLARGLAELPMGIIKATPVASFAILALLFIRGGGFSTFVAFLMVLPIAWGNVSQGIADTDRDLLELAAAYRFSPGYRLRYLYLPSVTPYLLAAARTGLGLAWKAGVAGEVIAIPTNAIGTELYNAKVYLGITDLFAWTAVIILLSLSLEWGAVRLLDWAMARYNGKGESQ